jgi:hypothetical protein
MARTLRAFPDRFCEKYEWNHDMDIIIIWLLNSQSPSHHEIAHWLTPHHWKKGSVNLDG